MKPTSFIYEVLYFFEDILKGSKRYRKKMGGNWYKKRDLDSSGGMQSEITKWTREEYEDGYWEIIDRESY